ncbi:hypothetical protein SAMN05216337_1007175 [Bradyrhizobium brasilense]|uniref:Uncharacterized protein n=1 Tax=Bradyrhizobium brasilense TaxID=1419277 RepID=A0A1G6RYR9_9BRAD|nr:hypothetical protein [Bradyrhizobium brasilense]SDD09573.1 hypothetical protein SAMN05216337_1007175 [Bradyrhizobium brasilense]
MAETSATTDQILQRLTELEAAVNRVLALLGSQGPTGGIQGDTQSANLSDADWQSLGKKLDDFGQILAPKEKAVLLMVFGAAAATYDRAGLKESPAVGGAASTIKISGALNRVKLSDGLKSVGAFTSVPVGGFGDSPVADSIGVGGDFTCVHGDWTKDLKAGAAFDDAMIRGRWNVVGGAGTPGAASGGAFGRSGPTGGGFG